MRNPQGESNRESTRRIWHLGELDDGHSYDGGDSGRRAQEGEEGEELAPAAGGRGLRGAPLGASEWVGGWVGGSVGGWVIVRRS